MNYPKISVILPLYNLEKYIGDCILSVIAQDYPEIEIIVIDDGSTDNSKKIVENLLENCGREYKLISKPNKGVSAARNDGIKASTGEWIVMVDADDVINRSFVTKLYENMDNSTSSCAVFSNYRILRDRDIIIHHTVNNKTLVFDRNNALNLYYTREFKFIIAAMLVNKRFVLENNILFDEDCRYSEDVIYIWKILSKMSEIRFINTPLYDYILHGGSTMTSSNIEKILTCRDSVLRLNDNYISLIDGMEELKKLFLYRYFMAVSHSAAKLLSYKSFIELTEELDLKVYIKSATGAKTFKDRILRTLYLSCPRLFYTVLRKR